MEHNLLFGKLENIETEQKNTHVPCGKPQHSQTQRFTNQSMDDMKMLMSFGMQ